MADHKNKADFNAMSVTLKNIYKNGDFSERKLENLVVSAVEKMVLPVDPNFEKATSLLSTNT